MELVVGADAGGTATTAVLATTDGTVLGRGRSGPGNPLTAGPGPAAAAVAAAVRQALGAHSPALVRAATLGVAGPARTARFAPALATLGVTGPIHVVGDVVTAFAAGSPAESGAVLIAGTGAIAAAVQAGAVVRTADGLGWLLGDEGSGRWLGLQAVRVAVRNWSSPLAARVAARTGVTGADDLVYWAQTLPWQQIGALAPLVCAAARDGDQHASAIVAEAVTHLVRTLDALGADGPVVLGGGLLACDTPVRDGVLATLRSRGRHTRTGHDPAAGAAWLAARPLSPAAPTALHETLLGHTDSPA
ncbi:N-acetylglucosamine kinase [Actinoplanes siamensis]|uniref:N-acetylglucosamine kinase n=1 Tax=Actinoplanes siamensis TaxID=1223317 RepID=A0A919TL86_9ACTN|nr:BadF/BadG/BcrA/BcrD ATPase family protein [Actinoplanes siamensis]GIF06891.1 N-acetylglucosamine kinase [Actinoplanes siamensis]